MAEEIINERKINCLTQIKLAIRSKKSKSAIARLEFRSYTGYSMKTLLKVAQKLNSLLEIKIQPGF